MPANPVGRRLYLCSLVLGYGVLALTVLVASFSGFAF